MTVSSDHRKWLDEGIISSKICRLVSIYVNQIKPLTWETVKNPFKVIGCVGILNNG